MGTRAYDEEHEQESEAAPEAPAPAPAGPAGMTPQGLLGLQRGSGNASVARMLAGRGDVLARKANVPLPGWGDNLVGDDDTNVEFTPSAMFRTEAVDEAMKNPFANLDKIKDLATAGQLSSSSMEQDGGYGGTLRIRAGTKGTISLTVQAHWLIDQKWNDEYDQTFSCNWTVEADLKGNLKISSGRQQLTPMGQDAPFQLSGDLKAAESEEDATVQISPQWQSFTNTDIPNIQVGVDDIPIPKLPIKGGGSVTLGDERTSPPGTLSRTFHLRLQVTDIPPAPEPQVKIGPIEMRKHARHEVLFEKPKQSKVSGPQENTLYKWWTSLSPETREMLRAGEEKVRVDGYASTTDKAANNRVLARDRVNNVMAILRDFGAKQFDDAAFGEYEEGVGEPEGEVEAQSGRKVVIEVVEAPVTIYEGDDAQPAPAP